jgi:hypothetical protein
VAADGYDNIGTLQHVVIKYGRFLSRDIDTDLPHHLDRSGILAVCLDTGGLHNDGVTADMPCPTFGNLGSAGIASTKNKECLQDQAQILSGRLFIWVSRCTSRRKVVRLAS